MATMRDSAQWRFTKGDRTGICFATVVHAANRPHKFLTALTTSLLVSVRWTET